MDYVLLQILATNRRKAPLVVAARTAQSFELAPHGEKLVGAGVVSDARVVHGVRAIELPEPPQRLSQREMPLQVANCFFIKWRDAFLNSSINFSFSSWL